jgi:hypothetical protein
LRESNKLRLSDFHVREILSHNSLRLESEDELYEILCAF